MKLPRVLKILGVLAIIAVPAYWLLVLHSPTTTAQYAIDVAELRRLASSLPGDGPTQIRYEHVMDYEFAEAMVVAGDPWKGTRLPVYAYQLAFADKTILVDTAMPRSMAKPDAMVPAYHPEAYARVSRALEQASQIVVTHEHADHIGGVLDHPRLAALLPALKLSAEQLARPELMRPAQLPEPLFRDYQGLRYERATAIAPGVVLLKSPGHTPGSQMVYVRRADGRELLFLGDVAWHRHSIETQRERPLFMTLIIGEDRSQVLAQLAALKALAQQEPALAQLPGHDGPVLQRLADQGLLQAGFLP